MSKGRLMKVEMFSYTPESGWSVDALPDLDSEQTLVVVFGHSEFLDATTPFEELSKAYPNSHLVGCSTAGEIFGTEVRDDTLAVAVTRFDHTRLKTTTTSVITPEDSFRAGEELARSLSSDATPKGVFVLADGLGVNGTLLAAGLNSVLSEGVVVTGGLAADGDRFQRTWVLSEGAPKGGTISAVAFYGDRIRIGHGSNGGWDRFGHERTITRSEGNVVFELDNKPALELYKDYLGDRASELPGAAFYFPLEIWENDEDERRLVRTVLAIDEDEQSLTFAGDVPEGWRAQLMKASFDRLVTAAVDAAKMAIETAGPVNLDNMETLSLAVSCVGRRIVLGERTEEEIEAALETLSNCSNQIGFYSYGEISPYAPGRCDLHNQTMTLTTLSET